METNDFSFPGSEPPIGKPLLRSGDIAVGVASSDGENESLQRLLCAIIDDAKDQAVEYVQQTRCGCNGE